LGAQRMQAERFQPSLVRKIRRRLVLFILR
jgi:hypothetical protein